VHSIKQISYNFNQNGCSVINKAYGPKCSSSADYKLRPAVCMRPVEVASAARECFRTHFTYTHPLEWRTTFVGDVNFARTAKFGERYAVTRFVGVTREDIVWWKLCSGRSEIHTELQLPPPCLLCQLYIRYILTVITASVLQQMGFRSVSYNSPRRGTARTLPKFLCRLCIVCFVSFCVLCVNVYCTTATGWQPNCS
jgi:hypothetical protein